MPWSGREIQDSLPAAPAKKGDLNREDTTASHGGKLAGVTSSGSVPQGWRNGEMWEQPVGRRGGPGFQGSDFPSILSRFMGAP